MSSDEICVNLCLSSIGMYQQRASGVREGGENKLLEFRRNFKTKRQTNNGVYRLCNGGEFLGVLGRGLDGRQQRDEAGERGGV